jgi:hypothetical protein
LCEPWACVEASYTVVYRTHWQEGGVVWLVGDGRGVSLGAAATWRPAKVVLDVRTRFLPIRCAPGQKRPV